MDSEFICWAPKIRWWKGIIWDWFRGTQNWVRSGRNCLMWKSERRGVIGWAGSAGGCRPWGGRWMTWDGRGETRPEIQSSGNKQLLRWSSLGAVYIIQKGHTGGSAWEAGNRLEPVFHWNWVWRWRQTQVEKLMVKNVQIKNADSQKSVSTMKRNCTAGFLLAFDAK